MEAGVKFSIVNWSAAGRLSYSDFAGMISKSLSFSNLEYYLYATVSKAFP